MQSPYLCVNGEQMSNDTHFSWETHSFFVCKTHIYVSMGNVWLISVQRFQRRRFKCEKLTDRRTTDAYPWQKLTWPMARWAKKRSYFWKSANFASIFIPYLAVFSHWIYTTPLWQNLLTFRSTIIFCLFYMCVVIFKRWA
jgi:hypothetical protein